MYEFYNFNRFIVDVIVLWPLLKVIYNICSSTVEAMEAKIKKYTRKCLGVPPCLTDIAFYCRQAKLKLPLKSILEEYKAGKIRLFSMLEHSKDERVRTAKHQLKTGMKWKAEEAKEATMERLRIKEVICHTQTNR